MMDQDKTLLSRIGQSWRNAFRDIMLIVVSITIAFTLDAWWNGRQEDRRANRHRAALQHEFAEILVGLRSDQEDITKASAATRELLREMGGRRPQHFADSLSRLINSSYDVGIIVSQGGALSAILSSGEIRLIRDDSLAYMLAHWPVVVEGLRYDNAILTASREQELRKRLITLGVPESAIATNLDGLNLPPTRFRFDPTVILSDPGIESMFVSRLVRLRRLDEQLEMAVRRVEHIRERLQRTD